MAEYKLSVETAEGKWEDAVVSEGTTIEEMAKKYQANHAHQIVLSMFQGKLRELNKEIKEDGTLSFITVTDNDGLRTYRRGVTILMQKAVCNLWGNDVRVQVLYSLVQGSYCELVNRELEAEDLKRIKEEMKRLAQADIPIKKSSVKTHEAIHTFHEANMYDKEKLLYYRRSSRVNLYDLDGMADYYYGYMVPSTGYVREFDLAPYEEGFVLLLPNRETMKVEPLNTSRKMHQTLRSAQEWSRMLGIGCVGALNEAICHGRGQELILTQEALMEEHIGAVAAQIASQREKKFVMIAGPSSSGKTTFSNRLSIQLSAKGLRPHPVGLDNYYVDREFCPKNPDGSFDFECLEALDVKQFNEDMTRLLAGEEVEMPVFNFKTGKREYRGNVLKLGAEDVLVIEGIHGLNDRLSYTLPAESKFRIYISALVQLNIDEHNPLPSTDGRLLRRIVRDARTRGTSAKETIAMWPSVRRGEEKYIFPFQEEADVMFNSALIYELAVLKVYAEPLLFQIPQGCPEYLEAKRLLKFLDYFIPLPTEGISSNSLIREFVGGSCFNV